MSCTDFPSTGLIPNVTTHTVGNITYIWTGIAWESQVNVPAGELVNDLSQAYIFDTLDDAVNSTTQFPLGKIINVNERTTGKGGGATYDVVDAATVSIDNAYFIQLVHAPNLALALRGDDYELPLDVTNQQFKTFCEKRGASIRLPFGTLSGLTEGVIELDDLDDLSLIGKGKHKSLLPFGVTIKVNNSLSSCTFYGFGMYDETADQDLTNSPKLLDLRRMVGTTLLQNLKYERVATHPSAGGGGIAFQYLDGCEYVICDDIYTLNASTAGIWSGRKSSSVDSQCGTAIVKNCFFGKTVDHGYPVGHNVSEVREVYARDNRYKGFFLSEPRVVATDDPNVGGVPALYYTDMIQGNIGNPWIAAIEVAEGTGPGGGDYTWVQSSATNNKCYGEYSGDSTDGSTGDDAPTIIHSTDEKFEDCEYMINLHFANEMIITNAQNVNNSCDNGFNHPGILSAQTNRGMPRLLEINGGTFPNIFFGKVGTARIAPDAIIGNANGDFNGIHGYALNNPIGQGESVIIAPCHIKNVARGAIQIDGWKNITIEDGYHIQNCGFANNNDLNRDCGISIFNTNVSVDYYYIGSGKIIDETGGNMPAGINTWSVRDGKGYVSDSIAISGWSNSAAANTTGIYGAQVTKNPANGQYVGPPKGYYRLGEKVNSQDGRFAGWKCVTPFEYGDVASGRWDSTTPYSISDRVYYAGVHWDALTSNTGSDPTTSPTDWAVQRTVLRRFGEAVDW